MPEYLLALTYAALAGLAIPAGGALASIDTLLPRWLRTEVRHTVIAFGAGVLIAAIALVLVPEGQASLVTLSETTGILMFVAGGVMFCFADRAIQRQGGGYSQLLAMLLDFVPEALALGAMLATAPGTGLLLAILMALQNLPEAFNAYREMRTSTHLTGSRILAWFTALALLGPLSAAAGYWLLQPLPDVLGSIMLFAAGGILYLIIQDIAPKVALRRAWAPPLGAVFGFGLGLVGQALTG
ncbi:MAG: divalent cation transporter [Pseudomonadota bacterium]